MTDDPRTESWWQASWSSAWAGAAAAIFGTLVTIVVAIMALAGNGNSTTPERSSDPTIAGVPTTHSDVADGAWAFMYGTMQPGHRYYPEIDGYVAETMPATAPGFMFDSGYGYPAAVFDPDASESISGYLLRWLPESASEANQVIADIENNLFRATRVETDQGISAIAYEWIGTTDDLTPVAGGAWTFDLENQ
ncbi:MAG: gamma-glutamylcyclotransferase [Acidimicrobiales bacterium]